MFKLILAMSVVTCLASCKQRKSDRNHLTSKQTTVPSSWKNEGSCFVYWLALNGYDQNAHQHFMVVADDKMRKGQDLLRKNREEKGQYFFQSWYQFNTLVDNPKVWLRTFITGAIATDPALFAYTSGPALDNARRVWFLQPNVKAHAWAKAFSILGKDGLLTPREALSYLTQFYELDFLKATANLAHITLFDVNILGDKGKGGRDKNVVFTPNLAVIDQSSSDPNGGTYHFWFYAIRELIHSPEYLAAFKELTTWYEIYQDDIEDYYVDGVGRSFGESIRETLATKSDTNLARKLYNENQCQKSYRGPSEKGNIDALSCVIQWDERKLYPDRKIQQANIISRLEGDLRSGGGIRDFNTQNRLQIPVSPTGIRPPSKVTNSDNDLDYYEEELAKCEAFAYMALSKPSANTATFPGTVAWSLYLNGQHLKSDIIHSDFIPEL